MFSDQQPTVPALLTTREAADRLGLTTTSLHDRRCKDDGLPIWMQSYPAMSSKPSLPVTMKISCGLP